MHSACTIPAQWIAEPPVHWRDENDGKRRQASGVRAWGHQSGLGKVARPRLRRPAVRQIYFRLIHLPKAVRRLESAMPAERADRPWR